MSGVVQIVDRSTLAQWVSHWQVDEIDKITQLSQGALSATWLVSVAGEQFVLKRRNPGVTVPGTNLAREAGILSEVAPTGLGPQVHHVDPSQGLIITEYLEGEVLGEQEISNPELLKRLCVMLRNLQQLPPPRPGPSMEEIVAGYVATIESSALIRNAGASISAGALSDVMTDWNASCEGEAICHNDLLYSNIVDRGDLALIDWEYANVGDPLFDLATLAHYHGFSDADNQQLLACYYGDASTHRLQRLAQGKIVVELVFTLWLLACRSQIDPAILPAYGDTSERLARLKVLHKQYGQPSESN